MTETSIHPLVKELGELYTESFDDYPMGGISTRITAVEKEITDRLVEADRMSDALIQAGLPW